MSLLIHCQVHSHDIGLLVLAYVLARWEGEERRRKGRREEGRRAGDLLVSLGTLLTPEV